MRITSVIENTSSCGLPVEHGLCLWIEACGRKFFFDLGQSALFAENAVRLGIEVNRAEFAVVSHGHYDHGGGIKIFTELNSGAPIYLQRDAFGEYYSMKEHGPKYIGLSKDLVLNSRIISTQGVVAISEGIVVFDGCDGHDFFSPANKRILKKCGDCLCDDTFTHEQSMVITEGNNRILIAGCAHSGIINIMRRAERLIGKPVTHVIAGLHLVGVEDSSFIDCFGQELLCHNCEYYTCHCTGEYAYKRLSRVMGDRIHYLSCGDSITI